MKTIFNAVPLVMFLLLTGCGDVSVPNGSGSVGNGGRAQAASPTVPPTPVETADPVLNRKNLYFVFDCSGSMDEHCPGGVGTKLEVAKVAIRKFLEAIPPETNLGLLIFDGSGVSERVPLGHTPENRVLFLKHIQEVHAGGGTPLASAMAKGYKKVYDQVKQKQLGYGEATLLVVTDGEASGGEDPKKLVDSVAKDGLVTIYAIGFGLGSNHSLNQKGKTVYREANSPNELQKGLDGVLAESEDFKPPSEFVKVK